MKANSDHNEDQMRAERLNRRQFLHLSALVGGALLAACAPPAAPQQPAAGGTGSTEGVTTISWWNGYSTDSVKQVAPQIISDFEAQNPNIKVEYEISGGPPGGGQLMEVLLSRIAGGTPPDSVTIWTAPSEFGAQGALLELDDMMESARLAKPDAFYEGPLNSCRWNGKTYGLPASAGAGCMFLNMEKFAAKGIDVSRDNFPGTWDELKAMSAEFVVYEGDTLREVGFVPWADSWLKPVWSGLNGGKIYDAANNQYVIDSPENIGWWEYMVGWLDEQYRGDLEALNVAGAWASVYPESAFHMGLSAMASEGSWACTDVEFPFEWEIVKFPVGPSGTKSVTGYWPNWWALPKGCPHPSEAFLFSEYFCTEGWVTWYKVIFDTPAWREFPTDVVTQKLIDIVGPEEAQAIHNWFADYLNDTVDMWNSPIESFASDTLNAAIGEIMFKTKTPAEALAEAQQRCQAHLEETLRGA
ncbi:MAG TPA: extracellular solute-binding protein [Caldilineaceae bacterium]|nr:extracellular solute-binding protein [Caldilineaceae bacterium]